MVDDARVLDVHDIVETVSARGDDKSESWTPQRFAADAGQPKRAMPRYKR
jgi:hypothetical protein